MAADSLHEKQTLVTQSSSPTKRPKYTIVIHGGAGTMSRADSTPEKNAVYKTALATALRIGYAVLKDGGEAMDAAVAAVKSMEDCPLFNSGKGAVFNMAGKNELEASIMLSKPPASHPEVPASRRGFSLTLLSRTRNPCQLAGALYLASDLVPHAMLSGSEAEAVGEALGIERVDPSYYFTEHRWREHRRGLGLPDTPYPDGQIPSKNPFDDLDKLPTGTVGAVALDIRGCIASVTSTGGRTNKMVGRIGDTPQMGTGFWAEEWQETRWFRKLLRKIDGRSTTKAVGVSGTGDGDYFIRHATCSTIVHRVKFMNEALGKAARICVEDLARDGGVGGVIALDSDGNYAMPLNCEGMYRGVIREDGVARTAIFADDELSGVECHGSVIALHVPHIPAL